MQDIKQKVLHSLGQKKNSVAILSISGGRDSMLLLRIFYELYQSKEIPQPLVFHFNHKLRSTSNQDAQLVSKYSKEFKLPFFYTERNVGSIAKKIKMSIEEVARHLRYKHLSKLAIKVNQSYIVTAHHADDYLESILIHLIRGGGPKSLETLGLWTSFRNVEIFRPLLFYNRIEINEMIKNKHIEFYEDESNESMLYLRNRIRKTITPLLLQEGLAPKKLWENFHSHELSLFQELDLRIHKHHNNHITNNHKSQYEIEYLYLDRSFFFRSLDLKIFLDLALKKISLPPLERNALKEIIKQITRGGRGFRLYYETKFFVLCSNRKDGVWLLRKGTAIFQKYKIEEISAKTPELYTSLYKVSYNHKVKNILLARNEIFLPYREGLKVYTKIGHKKLKKVFQERNLPKVLRTKIPIIYNTETKVVSKILFSFWENERDYH